MSTLLYTCTYVAGTAGSVLIREVHALNSEVHCDRQYSLKYTHYYYNQSLAEHHRQVQTPLNGQLTSIQASI